ncbi:MAG: hypothetical protein ABR599_07395 [Gemmatimonadota bacterium]
MPRSVSWGLLVLFLLFTSVVGVREAQAQWDWRQVAACAGACTQMFRNALGSLACGGCLADAGRILGRSIFDEGQYAGYGCAKAGVDC